MRLSTSIRCDDRPGGQERAVLCFPHAAGCASFFRPWQRLLPDARVHAVQYPGREDRFGEPFESSLAGLAETIADEVLAVDQDYSVLFGHSMGAYVAFEVAYLLQKAGRGVPAVVVSSASAPHDRAPVPYARTEEVLAYLERYEPLSAEITQDPDLLELILDYVKGDLELVSGYHEYHGKKLECPITGVVGADDVPEIRAGFAGWEGHTHAGFRENVVPGGHFYLRDAPPVQVLLAELAREETR